MATRKSKTPSKDIVLQQDTGISGLARIFLGTKPLEDFVKRLQTYLAPYRLMEIEVPIDVWRANVLEHADYIDNFYGIPGLVERDKYVTQEALKLFMNTRKDPPPYKVHKELENLVSLVDLTLGKWVGVEVLEAYVKTYSDKIGPSTCATIVEGVKDKLSRGSV